MGKKQTNQVLTAAILASLSGDATITSTGDIFDKTLPEGHTPESVNALCDHIVDFSASGVEALGLHAVKSMAADKKLEEVTGSVPMGRIGAVEIVTKRMIENTPPGAEAPIQTYGSTRLKVIFSPGSDKSDFSAAKSAIKVAAKAALS